MGGLSPATATSDRFQSAPSPSLEMSDPALSPFLGFLVGPGVLAVDLPKLAGHRATQTGPPEAEDTEQ